MSITITIQNNREYCHENTLVKHVTEACSCTEGFEGQRVEADPACPYCRGHGTTSEKRYPYELNIAQGNFASLWRSLGLVLREDLWGHIDGRTLLRVLAVPVERLTRPESQDQEDTGGTIIDSGISRFQAQRYIDLLKALADEASRREEFVVWG
jgi:hypothetical protein